MAEEVIRVDEYQEDETLIVRAELPGIDPDKDVTVTASEGILRIHAERREEHETEDKGYLHHELRRGIFSRNLSLPKGVTEADIRAAYKHGILEIRVSMPEAEELEPTKIPVETARP